MKPEYSNLVGSIYDCALDADAWETVLTRIADFCGASNSALVLVDPRINLSRVVTPRADPRVVEEYGRYWWQHDPTAAATAGVAPGVVTDLSATGRELYLASAFHNEFWAKSGLGAERLASNVFSDGQSFGSFVLQTSPGKDEITAEMRARFELVVPHMLRAMQTQRRIRQLEAALLKANHAPCEGVILLDRTSRPIWADPGAGTILAQSHHLFISDGRIALRTPGLTERLRAAVDACLNPRPARETGAMRIVSDGGGHLLIEIHPVAAAADTARIAGEHVPDAVVALVLRAPELRQDRVVTHLQDRFGLTQAEARVAIEIARGDGRHAAAARLGLSVNTVRTHLNSIFGKTGVSRQAELIRAIATL